MNWLQFRTNNPGPDDSVHSSFLEAVIQAYSDLLEGCTEPGDLEGVRLTICRNTRTIQEHTGGPDCWCHPVTMVGVEQIQRYIELVRSNGGQPVYPGETA